MDNHLKALFIACNLSPYRLAIHNALALKGLNYEVLFLAAGDESRKWELLKDKSNIHFRFRLMPGYKISLRGGDWPLNINFGLFKEIWTSNANVIVLTGYESPAYWFAVLYSKLAGKKIVFWNGSTLESGQSKSFLIKSLRKIFIKSADTYLAYGTRAKEFLEHYGAKSKNIITSCNTVDIDYFIKKSSLLTAHKEKIKKDKGFPAKIILFSGQLIPRKNLDILLEAFKEIRGNDTGLVILGDGPLKSVYEQKCKRDQIKNVFFEGHHQLSDLPGYYVIADLLVMPSLREVWGLVVNEAMACGLPILCSSTAGVSEDLVKDDVNGYKFNPKDIADLKNKLISLLSDDNKRNDMGDKSIEIIKNYTPENYAADLHKAIELASHC